MGGGRNPFAAPGRSADEARRRSFDAGRMGMAVMLVSLGVLFAAGVVAFLIIRSRTGAWRTAELPPLPPGLWAGTAAILGCSLAIHAALRAVRRDALGTVKLALGATTALGSLFLILQLWNWERLMAAQMLPTTRSLYAFAFYTMTGLHAAHVVGGLIPLAIVTDRALQGLYTSRSHAPILYCAMYWHFLDAVWCVLFAVLLAIG